MDFIRFRCRSHLNEHNVAVYLTDKGFQEMVEHVPSGEAVSYARSIDPDEVEETLSLPGLARVMSELEDLTEDCLLGDHI